MHLANNAAALGRPPLRRVASAELPSRHFSPPRPQVAVLLQLVGCRRLLLMQGVEEGAHDRQMRR